MRVIEHLAQRGLFRERDFTAEELSHNWLNIAAQEGRLLRHERGVWSRPDYTPTRYELVQIRFPKAVFWGPTALWLHGAADEEPETLWVAISNTSQRPTTLDPTVVVIRTRNLEAEVAGLRQERTFLELRVHSLERARRDIANINFHRQLERAANRDQFHLPPKASLLSAGLRKERRWHQIPAPAEQWIVK